MHNIKLPKIIVIVLMSLLLIVQTTGYCSSTDRTTDQSSTQSDGEVVSETDFTNGSKIEYLTWAEYGNRSVLRSKYNNIAFTWGHEGINQQYFYNNIFTYNLSKPEDYFCIPDDYIFAYNTNSSYRVKAVALNWTTDYKITDSGDTAIVKNEYLSNNGFHQFADIENPDDGNITLSNWTLPPVDIIVTHEMNYSESFIPMKITVRNNFSEPLRFLYVFQDGAWMTSFKDENQEGVNQYWPDGDYQYPRLWSITDENRNSNNNWVGMYDDKEGGMFAATYAPPQSDGVKFHATWVPTADITGNYSPYVGSDPGVDSLDNILLGINVPNNSVSYNDEEYKIHGTLIDFGVIYPGEEKSQSLVKIMFTGYTNRTDMRNKIDSIIQNVTDYYDSGQYQKDY